jgi:hypothetical protein
VAAFPAGPAFERVTAELKGGLAGAIDRLRTSGDVDAEKFLDG